MKQVLIRSGQAIVADVPAPEVGAANVLVRVEYSCISAGTEVAGMRMSGLPLHQRALKQPQNVQRVLAMVREQGVRRTMERVRGKLAAGTATGYSAAGTIVAVGAEVEGYSVGDRVACAGAGIANHAEVIDVPVNLTVRVPNDVALDHASTVTLGAIAMQGLRRAQPTLGETVVVIGLGILGQLTAQMLCANGCKVIGVDLDPARIALALGNGMQIGVDPVAENYIERVLKHSAGLGADAVIVTAASPSHQIISDAMQATRKKGRVVLVGDVGLNLNRGDFYAKELDFLVSTSYGPGRYDPVYEEQGQDYPLAYVRWTENRNMQAYMDLLASNRVRVAQLVSGAYPVDRASEAYSALDAGTPKPLIVLLSYPQRQDAARQTVYTAQVRPREGALRVGLVGASSFAQAVHLPNMRRLGDRVSLRAVMSRTGANAKSVAEQYGASYCTTSLDQLLDDADVDLVMITSRHDAHGDAVLRALRAGKHVFVEKPLTLDPNDIGRIEAFYQNRADAPLLMAGYNRRFSPPVAVCLQALRGRTTPLIVDYRMNAGFIPRDHWVHGPQGGGRNLGEACHIYDLFNALVGGVAHTRVSVHAIRPPSPMWGRDDNFVVTISYDDGSVCSLTYTALGDKAYPKERMEIFTDGKVFSLDDYKSLAVSGGRQPGWKSATPQKGQFEELRALIDALHLGTTWPIPLDQLLRTSAISFAVEAQLNKLD
jgi:predicted dehydrogenase/threonine dehydrogenase-like Zn-dependent dehydrogenase